MSILEKQQSNNKTRAGGAAKL